MSWLGDVGGGLVSSAFNSWSASKAASKAYGRQVEMMKNSHQWEVEDLKKAGLNPILSANGGANAYSAPQEQVIGFDLVGQRQASSSAKQADTAAEQMKSNITLQDELGWKAKQDALNAASSAAFTNYQNQLLHDYGAKVKMKELDRLDSEIEAIKSNAVSSARQASAAEMSAAGSYRLATANAANAEWQRTSGTLGGEYGTWGAISRLEKYIDSKLKNANIGDSVEYGD